MRILHPRLLVPVALAALLLAACESTPADPGTPTGSPQSQEHPTQPTTKDIRHVSHNPPDFTQMFTNIVPGRVVSVSAYRIDAHTWHVEIQVLQCAGDCCVGIWIEYIYTCPPEDPNFVISVREALDTDRDGIWNWQEKIGINYQQ